MGRRGPLQRATPAWWHQRPRARSPPPVPGPAGCLGDEDRLRLKSASIEVSPPWRPLRRAGLWPWLGTTCLPGHLGELRASRILRWEGSQGSASFKGAGGSLGTRPCPSGDIKGPGRGARSRPALRLQREWPASPALPWVQGKAPHGDWVWESPGWGPQEKGPALGTIHHFCCFLTFTP